jgi:membrane-associated phospholipid phosphatase
VLVAAGLFMAFTGLAVGVQDAQIAGWVAGLDAFVAGWFGTHRSDALDVAAGVIAALGGPAATAVTGLVGGVLLSLRARSAIPGIVVIGTVGAATLAEITFRAVVVTRPRGVVVNLRHLIETQHHRLPLKLLPGVEPNSFPSGHVTGSAALLGIVAVCVGVGRSRIVRAWLVGLVCASVLVVAVSRLYLRAHWLTDVIGGALLAGVFVILGACVLGALESRSRQETPVQNRPATELPAKIH